MGIFANFIKGTYEILNRIVENKSFGNCILKTQKNYFFKSEANGFFIFFYFLNTEF
jgi:hypothetical protein